MFQRFLNGSFARVIQSMIEAKINENLLSLISIQSLIG